MRKGQSSLGGPPLRWGVCERYWKGKGNIWEEEVDYQEGDGDRVGNRETY